MLVGVVLPTVELPDLQQCSTIQPSSFVASPIHAAMKTRQNARDSTNTKAAMVLARSKTSWDKGENPLSNIWNNAASRAALSADLLAASRTSNSPPWVSPTLYGVVVLNRIFKPLWMATFIGGVNIPSSSSVNGWLEHGGDSGVKH